MDSHTTCGKQVVYAKRKDSDSEKKLYVQQKNWVLWFRFWKESYVRQIFSKENLVEGRCINMFFLMDKNKL